MPDKAWSARFLQKNLRRLFKQAGNLTKPALLAAGLLTVACLLMVTVVYGLNIHQQNHIISPPAQQPIAVNTALPAAQPVPASQSAPAPADTSLPAAAKEQVPATPVAPTAAVKQPEINYRPENARRPLAGTTTLAFGWYEHSVYKDWRYHTGIDIASPEGTPVTAIWGGKVSAVYQDKHTGLTVSVKTREYTVYYGSLALVSVTPGEIIAPGSKLGEVGRCSAEQYIHLHLAIKKDDKYLDPARFLP